MTKAEQIREALKALLGDGNKFESAAVLNGVVISVKEKTADVEVDGLVYHDVQLQAIADGSGKSFLFFPKQNTKCLIANIEHGERYYMLASDEVEKIVADIQGGKMELNTDGFQYDKGNATFSVKGGKITIKSGSNSLGDLIDALLDALTKLTVTSSAPASPTSIPLNVTDFIDLKIKFKTLLN